MSTLDLQSRIKNTTEYASGEVFCAGILTSKLNNLVGRKVARITVVEALRAMIDTGSIDRVGRRYKRARGNADTIARGPWRTRSNKSLGIEPSKRLGMAGW